MADDSELNVYLHVPFCASKCGYCAFYSETAAEQWLPAYRKRVEQELSGLPRRVSSIYIGGGTPTRLPIDVLEAFFSLLPEAQEISIEANPETLTEEMVTLLRKHVTRISVGVQSFQETLRRRIGRKCSQQALEKALSLVREAEFPHWNIDLMYALPGQTLSDWENNLERALAQGADHLSCYSLTVEENARLGGTLREEDDFAADCWQRTGELLAAAGMPRYEISNYACPGAECRHNRSVWRGGLLRGIGPSAAGFDGVDRFTFPPSLARWCAGAEAEFDRIPREARLREIFTVNLRTVSGWTREMWHFEKWEKMVSLAEEAAKKLPGCLEISSSRVTLSEYGLSFWNSVAEELL